MADYITKIRTSDGDKQIDYLSLANLPGDPLPLSKGGTGVKANNMSEIRTALGVATLNHEHDLADIVGDSVLEIKMGGTGANTKEGALKKLGINATATELNYCDGVTSSIQTQLDGKAASSHGTHVSYGTSTSVLGTSSAGTATTVSRSDHVHALPALTSCTGTLTVEKGGTNITSNPSMLVNLESTSAASVFAATPRPGVTGALKVNNGGTGANNASDARSNLGITSGKSLPSSANDGDIFFLYS